MLNDKRVHCVAYYAKLISSIWCASYKHARTAQHSTIHTHIHTKIEESKTKTNEPTNKPFIQNSHEMKPRMKHLSWKKPYVQICTTISRANKVSTRHHFIYIFVCGYLKRRNNLEVCFRFFLILAYQWSGVNVCFLLKCHQTLKGTAGLLHFYLSISKGLLKILRIRCFWGIYIFWKIPKWGKNNKCYI